MSAACHPRTHAPASVSRVLCRAMTSTPQPRGLHKDAALSSRSHSRASRRGGGTLGVGPKQPKTRDARAEWLKVVPQRPLTACLTPGKRNDRPLGSCSHGEGGYFTSTILVVLNLNISPFYTDALAERAGRSWVGHTGPSGLGGPRVGPAIPKLPRLRHTVCRKGSPYGKLLRKC